jgi:FMN phosphatase YigB (HAD superfamily)
MSSSYLSEGPGTVKAKFALFDLDDTLVATGEAFRAFCRVFVLEHGLAGDVEARTREVLDRVTISRTWMDFTGHAEEWFGITTPPAELFDWIVATYPASFVLDARVAKGLVVLRENGWRLGIVTNGTTAVQQAKIDGVGLRGYVDFIIDSEAAGSWKPDRRIFELAAEGLGVELGPHGWMVGDNHANDVGGGHEAGLRTIWLPYGAEQPVGAAQPDRTCADVVEAIEIIAADGPAR